MNNTAAALASNAGPHEHFYQVVATREIGPESILIVMTCPCGDVLSKTIQSEQ